MSQQAQAQLSRAEQDKKEMEKMFKAKMAKQQQQMSMKPSESPSNAAAATILSEMGGSLRGRSMQTAEERQKKFAAQ